MRRAPIPVLLMLVIATACQGGPDLSGRPTAADEPVINITRFKTGDAAADRLTALPIGTIYGDGRVVRPAPQTAVFPGPALPALQVTMLDTAGVDAVLTQAAAGGLVGADRELRLPTEADPTITAFDIYLDGDRRRTIVESLAEVAPDDPRLPPKGQEERAAMNAVVGMLTDPATTLGANIVGEDTVYAPEGVLVVVSPTTDLEPATTEPTVVEWPLADLAGLASPVGDAAGVRCAVVDGSDWTTLEPAVAGANQLTRWSSGGAEYALRFRPLLPGESGCPG
ncbi:MAG: hypothetical protein ACHQ02_00060 [Candidatus Limnocylindrales bacterium]